MKDKVVPIRDIPADKLPPLIWMFARKRGKRMQYLAEFRIENVMWTWNRPEAYWLESTKDAHFVYDRFLTSLRRITGDVNPEAFMISTETAEVLAEDVHCE